MNEAEELKANIEYERERKAQRDFRWARATAISRHAWNWLVGIFAPTRRVAKDLLDCYDDYRERFGEVCCTATMYMTVEVERITGSVGRCTAFDSFYAPLCSCTKDRWIRVARAYRDGAFLPPVKLYKIGDRLFVYDGNHRVSVARSQSIPTLEAAVKELFFTKAL